MGDALPVRSVDARVVGRWQNAEAGSSGGTAATDSAARPANAEGDETSREASDSRTTPASACDAPQAVQARPSESGCQNHATVNHAPVRDAF